MNSIWFVSTVQLKKIMKKYYKYGPDPKIKHRVQMGETTLLCTKFSVCNNKKCTP